MDNRDIVFGKKWFQQHQSKLLWFLNAPVIKYWFRWCLAITKLDIPVNETINEISCSYFSFGGKTVFVNYIYFKDGHREIFNLNNRIHRRFKDKLKIKKGLAYRKTTDFRTHDKYSKRLYYAFKPLWYLMHFFDWAMLDRLEFASKLSFGFSTLTAYPDAGSGSTTVDGSIKVDAAGTWAGARDATTGTVQTSSSTDDFVKSYLFNSQYYNARSFYTLDTAAIDDAATIESAIFSLAGGDYASGNVDGSSVNLYANTQASANNLVGGDYDNIGSTPYATAINVSSFNTASTVYNDFTLNATGLAAISKTGITYISARMKLDVDNTTPTGFNYIGASYADVTGTSKDPKLVVTYSISSPSSSISPSPSSSVSASESPSPSSSVSLSISPSPSSSQSPSSSESPSPSLSISLSISPSPSSSQSPSSSISATPSPSISPSPSSSQSPSSSESPSPSLSISPSPSSSISSSPSSSQSPSSSDSPSVSPSPSASISPSPSSSISLSPSSSVSASPSPAVWTPRNRNNSSWTEKPKVSLP